MAWIESHQDLEKNGKVLEFANKLNINKYQAIGHLHALWWWALDNAEDGELSRFSSVTVTQACGWDDYIKDEVDLSRINEITNRDKGGRFVPALIECGFLDQHEDGLWIHNWRDYTERYFKSIKINKRVREQVKKRVKKYRERNSNVTLMKRSVTVPTLPNQTLPNQSNKDSSVPPNAFDLIWAKYPRRKGQKASERHFKASVKTTKDWLDIQNALENYKREINREHVEAQYVKHGSTWFNNWRDDVSYSGVEMPRPPAPIPAKPKEPEVELSDEDRKAGLDALASIKSTLRKGTKAMPAVAVGGSK